MQRKAEVKCQCELCQDRSGTLQVHHRLMAGIPVLHVYRRGPALSPERDGLVVLYSEREHEQVQ